MTFVEVSKDVIIQPPAGGFTYTASGSIYKGQAVYLVDEYTVKVPTTNDKIMFGIAGYNKVNGQDIIIYSVGNIVKCKLSSSSILTAGTKVGVIAGGYVSDSATYNSGAIITNSATSNYGDGEILILGHGYNL
jgi:hypothetical protein